MKIQKNIPIPPRASGSKGQDWSKFEVGDSAFFAGREASTAAIARKATGWKFTARTVTENGRKGVRIWRVE